MSSGSSDHSDGEDRADRQTYYVISDYTAVEDSQVMLGSRILSSYIGLEPCSAIIKIQSCLRLVQQLLQLYFSPV